MKYKMEMTLKSPLFIGQAVQKLTPMDYIYYENKVYPISERAFFGLLQKKNLMNNFTIYLESLNEQAPKQLNNYLSTHHLLNEKFINQISKSTIHVDTSKKFMQYHPFVKDIYGQPYIPGSALKGAIRTGILYGAIRRMKEENSCLYRKTVVEKITSQLRGKLEMEVLNEIEKSVFQNLSFPESLGINEPAHRDLLRIIKVSDSNSLPPESTRIVEVKVLNYNRESKLYDKTRVFVECLPKDTKVEFEIVFDEYIYSQLKKYSNKSNHFYNLEEILELWTSLSKKVMDDDIKYFKHALMGKTEVKQQDNSINVIPMLNYYKDGFDANFRLGWGCGMNSMTILLLMEPELRSQWGRRLSRKDFVFFPKTRKVSWGINDPGSPLGWAKLKVLE